MSIHYPKGVFLPQEKPDKMPRKKDARAANRGMGFEDDINATNEIYLNSGRALIYKRTTPINVVRVDYSKGAKIVEAYFEKQSTTDYNGVYRGRYIDFEAKSTHSKTSFPLHNIPKQQIEHLKNVIKHQGIAFFLINCYQINKTFLVPAEYIIEFYENKPRSSIPFSFLNEHGLLVKESYPLRYDYLREVDRFFFAK